MPKLRTDIDKIFFSIGEVAKKYNVNVSLIRFWEKNGHTQAKKTKNVECSQEDMYNLDIIYHLVKERGFTLEGAKRN